MTNSQPTINQANLAILLAALESKRWHFDMGHVFSVLGSTRFLVTQIVEKNSCSTAACIHGTIKLLSATSDKVDARAVGKESHWLGVPTELYGDIIMPPSYRAIAHETPEHIQRRAAILMLKDLAKGKVPSRYWLSEYIEIAEGELQAKSTP